MKRIFAILLLVTAALAATAAPVAADHVGQTLDCGEARTFTVVGQETGAGFDADTRTPDSRRIGRNWCAAPSLVLAPAAST